MLFQYQALSALAFTAVALPQDVPNPNVLPERYAYAKQPCSTEEVAFCQKYVEENTLQTYRDCRHFG
jgi:hypothetical protein